MLRIEQSCIKIITKLWILSDVILTLIEVIEHDIKN